MNYSLATKKNHSPATKLSIVLFVQNRGDKVIQLDTSAKLETLTAWQMCCAGKSDFFWRRYNVRICVCVISVVNTNVFVFGWKVWGLRGLQRGEPLNGAEKSISSTRMVTGLPYPLCVQYYAIRPDYWSGVFISRPHRLKFAHLPRPGLSLRDS